MRKIFVLMLFCNATFGSFGQKNFVGIDFANFFYSKSNDKVDSLSSQSKIGYTYSPAVFYSRLFKHNWLATIYFGKTINLNKEDFDVVRTVNTGRFKDENILKQDEWYSKIGIGKQIVHKKILFTPNIYLGIKSITNLVRNRIQTILDTSNSNIIRSTTEKNIYPNSIATSLSFVPSLQYQLYKGIYLGAEINIALNYVNYYGSNSREIVEYNIANLDIISLKEHSTYNYNYEFVTSFYPIFTIVYKY